MSREARLQQIGIDRPIRLQWLEDAAHLLLSRNDPMLIKQRLEETLSSIFPSSPTTTRGSLSKTVTVIMNTWVKVPSRLIPFRDNGLELLTRLEHRLSLPIHWGMLMAVYPFWGAVAIQSGRLLRIQGDVGASEIQRRMREQYGERETVARRARYVLRAFVDWKVLQETNVPGVYTQGLSFQIDDQKLITWLIEASLLAKSSGSASLQELLNSTALFPFRLQPISAEQLLSNTQRLESLRHGLNEDLVMLREHPVAIRS